jgi:hypothetical protein
MLRRRALVVTVAVAATVATTVTPAAAVDNHPVAIYAMDEPAGATTMVDSSGHHLNGTIGREVLAGGGLYRFTRLEPNTPPPHPQHLATVPSNPQLDPGGRDYLVSLRLRTPYHFGNIIQKGQATVPGGNFKLQIPNGLVQCLFRGSRGTIIVTADHAINDGRWHTVQCARTSAGVTLTLDGRVAAHRDGWTGPIANSWPLSIGGKTACDQQDVSCDYFAGDIDRVEIDAR